jgi:hypothetical protein
MAGAVSAPTVRTSPMLLKVDDAQHATILAALRYYQQQGMGEPLNRDADIHEISTNWGRVMSSLDEEGIDQLCQGLNADLIIDEKDRTYVEEHWADRVKAMGYTGKKLLQAQSDYFTGAMIARCGLGLDNGTALVPHWFLSVMRGDKI